MISESTEYIKYFHPEQEVGIDFHHDGKRKFDNFGIIRSIEKDCVHIEFHRELPSGIVFRSEAESVITSLGGWLHCCCRAVLEENMDSKNFKLRFRGPVIIRQQREYFRWDVYIPLRYSIPENQQLAALQEAWTNSLQSGNISSAVPNLRPHENGYIVVGWTNGEIIPPQRVNLSGGGVRILIREEVEIGTLVNLEIFIPLHRPKVIYAVAMVLRINKLLLIRDNHTYYSVAMKFVCLDEEGREDIISYLFVEQRNSLQAKISKI